MRLSHKYKIQDVQEQALGLLRERYTSDFDKWRCNFPNFVASPLSKPSTHYIGIVNIARLTNTPSLLPPALYACCTIGPALLNGWKREDGRIEQLSTDDLKRCFAAQERLCQEGVKMMCQILSPPGSTACSRPAECSDILVASALVVTPHTATCRALTSWSAILHMEGFCDVCPECKEELKLRDSEARRELWGKLPEIFRITVPGWGKTVGPEMGVSS